MLRRAWIPVAVMAGALVLAWPTAPASAGTVELLNDEEIEGEILDVGIDFVVIRIPGGRQSIPLREVRDVKFRSNESMWEKKLKDALARAKQQKDAERARRLENEREKIRQIPVGNFNPAAPPPTPVDVGPSVAPVDVTILGSSYDDDHIFLRFPVGFTASRVEPQVYTTFKDDRGTNPWSFNITYFSARDEGDYDMIRQAAQNQLERIPSPAYKARQRMPIAIGKRPGERTTGLFERNGRAIRHDQLVLPTSNGVLVIHFFSPGATMDESSVPDVEKVIKSIQLK